MAFPTKHLLSPCLLLLLLLHSPGSQAAMTARPGPVPTSCRPSSPRSVLRALSGPADSLERPGPLLKPHRSFSTSRPAPTKTLTGIYYSPEDIADMRRNAQARERSTNTVVFPGFSAAIRWGGQRVPAVTAAHQGPEQRAKRGEQGEEGGEVEEMDLKMDAQEMVPNKEDEGMAYYTEFRGFFSGLKGLSREFTDPSKYKTALKEGIPLPAIVTPSPYLTLAARAMPRREQNCCSGRLRGGPRLTKCPRAPERRLAGPNAAPEQRKPGPAARTRAAAAKRGSPARATTTPKKCKNCDDRFVLDLGGKPQLIRCPKAPESRTRARRAVGSDCQLVDSPPSQDTQRLTGCRTSTAGGKGTSLSAVRCSRTEPSCSPAARYATIRGWKDATTSGAKGLSRGSRTIR